MMDYISEANKFMYDDEYIVEAVQPNEKMLDFFELDFLDELTVLGQKEDEAESYLKRKLITKDEAKKAIAEAQARRKIVKKAIADMEKGTWAPTAQDIKYYNDMNTPAKKAKKKVEKLSHEQIQKKIESLYDQMSTMMSHGSEDGASKIAKQISQLQKKLPNDFKG